MSYNISEFMCSENTQDPPEDEQQFDRVKDKISSYHLKTNELADDLSNFSDTSEAQLDEIMNKPVMEGFLSKSGADSYAINRQKAKHLLQMAILSSFRGLSPEMDFNDKPVPALAVHDALQKKYLKTLLFCVCEAVDGPMIKEYAYSFSYFNSDSQEVSMDISQEVSMDINSNGNKTGGTVKCNSTTYITPDQMRSSACKMVQTLVQLMRTLDKMQNERIILMKLFYYDDVTPVDYEPSSFFQGCSREDVDNPRSKSSLKMEVGNLNKKPFVLALKLKGVLDPFEDENDENQDDVSLRCRSFTSIVAMIDNEGVALAVDSRESREKHNKTVEVVGDIRKKLITVHLTIVLAGTGPYLLIDRIGEEVQDRVEAKDDEMDLIAIEVSKIMSKYCAQHRVKLEKEEEYGIYLLRTIDATILKNESTPSSH